ncbi:MAG: LysR family transcriptional regulator [Halioglobus sp.]
MLVTIERMEALVAVLETGSFSAAARQMGKTPSAVSRIVQHFELDLGVDLFDRVEGQAPKATDTARSLYYQAVEILPRLEILENKATGCQEGVESKLVLAIHGLAFNERLEQALKQFVVEFPGVELTVLDPDSFGLDQSLIDGDVDLVFMPSSQTPTRSVSYSRFAVMEWCYVASANHPLAQLQGELTEADLLPHTQLLPAVSDVVTQALQDSMRICPRFISCQRIVQIQEFLMMGLGFALMPRYAAALLLEGGHLRELRCESAAQGMNVWDVEVRWTNLGTAGSWLLETLTEQP